MNSSVKNDFAMLRVHIHILSAFAAELVAALEEDPSLELEVAAAIASAKRTTAQIIEKHEVDLV